VRIDALVGIWGSAGLTCVSNAGSFPDVEGGFNIHCEKTDESANASFVGSAVYWTLDAVQTVSLSVSSATFGGTVNATETADQVLFPMVEALGGEAAREWIESVFADATCDDGCSETFGESKFVFESGSHGFYGFRIEPGG
jgi:hypothetical protein